MLIEKTCGNDMSLDEVEHSENGTNDANHENDNINGSSDAIKSICVEFLGYKRCMGCTPKPANAVIKIRRPNVPKHRRDINNGDEIMFVKPIKVRPPEKTFQSVLSEEMAVEMDFDPKGYFIENNLQRLYDIPRDFNTLHFEKVWLETQYDRMYNSQGYFDSTYTQTQTSQIDQLNMPSLNDTIPDLLQFPTYNNSLTSVQEAMINEWINHLLPGTENIPQISQEAVIKHDSQDDDLSANAALLEKYLLEDVNESVGDKEAAGEASWAEIEIPVVNIVVPPEIHVAPEYPQQQDPNDNANENNNNNNNNGFDHVENMIMNGFDDATADDPKSDNFSNENDHSTYSNIEDHFAVSD